MKTSFSLTYVECSKSTSNILDSIVGPVLFATHESAVDALFLYVRSRLSDGLEDVFEGYIENSDTLSTYSANDAMGYVLNDFDEKVNLIDYYFGFMSDDSSHSSYSITELPTVSLIDQIIDADAIEIDGDFIRSFSLPCPEEYSNNLLQNDLSVFLEAEFTDAELNLFEFCFSVEELTNANYDPVTKVWKVGEFDVLPIKFA